MADKSTVEIEDAEVASEHSVNPNVNYDDETDEEQSGIPIHPLNKWNMYFKDGQSRIDFVLTWNAGANKKSDPAATARSVFETNLMEEGLQLEYEYSETDVNFLKIHAPLELLLRYADILKLRLPIKVSEIQTGEPTITKDATVTMFDRLTSPYQYDLTKLPPITRSYTAPYSSSKNYLFEVPDNPEDLFTNATRSWIVDYILRRKYFADHATNNFAFGINKMLNDNYYLDAYPLHEGQWRKDSEENTRKILYDCWASWKNFYKFQPVDHVRLYFGETIALYFAWLGYYTSVLIPPMIVGLIVFIYGLVILFSNPASDELCDPNNGIIMCPLCDYHCSYWKISDSCLHAVISRIFDNGGTVFFAVFMSLWGTFFLEFWKRTEATIQYKWDLTTYQGEEQPPRPEYLSKLENRKHKKLNTITGLTEPYLPFWRRRFPKLFTSYSIIILLAVIALSVILSLIANRIALFAAFNFTIAPIATDKTRGLIANNATIATTVVSALINLVIILCLNCTYGRLAFWLTDWECLRTQNEYDNSITLKLFVLQFINYFAAMFYIAFFKGQFTGRPGDYFTFFGNRQEECDPAGCLIELCIQLGITMVGKQLIQENIRQLFLPRIMIFVKAKCHKTHETHETPEQIEVGKSSWEEDNKLLSSRTTSLFHEYLAMVMQFGFLTIFCSAFPLGPLFAFMNNIMEIRVDATKFVTQIRRPVADKSASIGIWYGVLYAISRIAIVTNAFIIVMTSEFIPRLMYTNYFSEDGSLTGYINFTLSYFNTSDYQEEHRPDFKGADVVEVCRYQDFRNPPWHEMPYEKSSEFWLILAARLAFVCVFENVVVVITGLLSWIIPDIPSDLKGQIHREAYITNEILLATELKRARGEIISGQTVTNLVKGFVGKATEQIYNITKAPVAPRLSKVQDDRKPSTTLKYQIDKKKQDDRKPSTTLKYQIDKKKQDDRKPSTTLKYQIDKKKQDDK